MMQTYREIIISIIVPVYNNAPYLSCCIDSILAQTFTNFELILVNDGSTDNSPLIIDEYSRIDSRIRAVHKTNGGVSSARNAGLDICLGKYVVFCDGDDYVESNYLLDLISAFYSAPDQDTLIISNMSLLTLNGKITTQHKNARTILLDHGTLDDFFSMVDDYSIYGPTCKLYRNDLIKMYDLRYNQQLVSAEDFDFNMRYIKKINHICMISTSQYIYRIGYKANTTKFIDQSAILSAHIMAENLISLTKRMGIYQDAKDRIAYTVAEKHWLSRLPRVFCPSSGISLRKRLDMYVKLRGNSEYRTLCKEGAAQLHICFGMKWLIKLDRFLLWYCYFAIYHLIKGK